MKKYNLNYSLVKEYLENIFINENQITEYRKELEKENLLINKKFNYKSIGIIGYDNIEPYIKEKLNNYNVDYIKQNQETNETHLKK